MMLSPSSSAIIGCICFFTILVIGDIISRSQLSFSGFQQGVVDISAQPTAMIRGQFMQQQQRDYHYRFIPFPYNTLGSGADMQCQWETKDLPDPNAYDLIQQTAYKEGVCIPIHPNSSIHVFSSDEARGCLHSKRVVVSGDSYMKQLFVGMADIILGELLNNNEEILNNTQRSQFVESAQQLLVRQHEKDPSFPIIEYLCEATCYGYNATFSKICSDCINAYSLEDEENTIAVVGAEVHILESNTLSFAIREINNFLSLASRTIFVSSPSSDQTDSSRRDGLYESLLPSLAPRNMQHPFLDVYHMTRSCVMKNCSYDGGHGSRYVNRWKAQLLLNTLCQEADSMMKVADREV